MLGKLKNTGSSPGFTRIEVEILVFSDFYWFKFDRKLCKFQFI